MSKKILFMVPCLLSILLYATVLCAEEYRVIGCQEADGINNCGRLTIKINKRLDECRASYSEFIQNMNWKKKNYPMSSDFAKVKKLKKGTSVADCCLRKINGFSVTNELDTFADGIRRFNAICNAAGI
jgi:hypothetical protein